MAGVSVRYDLGTVSWTFTLTEGSPATHYDFKWGLSSGSYPNTKTYLVTDPTTDHLYNMVPGLGQYYAVFVARNAIGDGSQSAEVPFVVIAGPLGITAQAGAYSVVGTSISFVWRGAWLRYKR